jgi:hypothetical protein
MYFNRLTFVENFQVVSFVCYFVFEFVVIYSYTSSQIYNKRTTNDDAQLEVHFRRASV